MHAMNITAPTITLAQSDLWFGKGGLIAGRPASDLGSEADFLFMAIFWISTVSFVILMVLMLFFVLKYRYRPGVKPQRSPAHNTPLELAWSVVPLLILVWIFFQGFWTYMKMQTPVAGAETINVNAQMWVWSFTYPNGAISAEQTLEPVGGQRQPVFVVPAGVPVELKMTSTDVIHSFWVPAFRGKRDVFPNRYTTYRFTANELTDDDSWHEPVTEAEKAEYEAKGIKLKGPLHETRYQYRDHYLFCAEYCGDQHSEMAGIIRVVSPEKYVEIVTAWATPDTGDIETYGNWLRAKYGCASCHSIDGSTNTGPTWQNLFGYQFSYNTGSKTVDENHIRTSIYDPGADVRSGFANQMQSYQGIVTDEHMTGFIRYFNFLSDRGNSGELLGGEATGESGGGEG